MELTEQEKAQEFVTAYNELCIKYGLQIVTTPVFIPTNHGTFEIGLRTEVVKKAAA